MLLSRYQNAGQNRDIKITNRSFENVAQFKYLGMTVTNQNLFQDEIKETTFLDCLLPFGLESPVEKLKNYNIQYYNFFLWLCMGLNLVLTLKEDHRL
jgi:hypothetical protein